MKKDFLSFHDLWYLCRLFLYLSRVTMGLDSQGLFTLVELGAKLTLLSLSHL